MRRNWVFCIICAALITAVFLFRPLFLQAAPAASIPVTTTADELNDNGNCSLREAVQAANTNAVVDACPAGTGANDEIIIPAGLYLLTLTDATGVVEENGNATGDLDILESVSLTGAGAGQTVIDGNHTDRIIHQPFGGVDLNVSGVTVQNGDLGVGTSINYSGGGFSLISGSALTLTNVLVTQNQASPDQALLSSGSGGGIYNNGGQLTLIETAVISNKAGFGSGIYNTGVMSISDSSILDNEATYFGAGILHAGISDVTIRASTVSRNIAGTNGGGLYLTGGVTNLSNVTVSHNRANSYLGGGIWVYYEGILGVNIDHSTIYANFAGTGGGIYNTHQQGRQGPWPAPAPAAARAGVITLKNTIVAANTGGNCGRSAQTEPIVSMGYNLDSADDCEFQALTDQINADPALGPLQENGGPTPTHGLRTGSAAIDAGACTDILAAPVTVDQRGVSRPQNSACDIGSVEYVADQNSDLRLEKVVSAATIGPAEPLVYTMTVHNDGPDPATNVTVTDTLPAGITGVSAGGSSWTCQAAGSTVICTLTPDLAVGQAPLLVLQGTAPTAGGVLTNTAVVAAATFDVDQSQNTDSAVTTVIQSSPEADLLLQKQADPPVVRAGSQLTYTLSVTNQGPDEAAALVLDDTLPAGVAYLGSAGTGWTCQETSGVVSCQMAALAAGATSTVTVQTLAPPLTGTITNTAVITSATLDPNMANNAALAETAVVPISTKLADLAIVQTITPTILYRNDLITITVTITNHGPDPAADLVLTDTLPTTAAWQQTISGNWQCAAPTTSLTCTLPTLPAHGSAALQVRLQVTSPIGELRNNVSVSSKITDTDMSNNQSTLISEILLPIRSFLPLINNQ